MSVAYDINHLYLSYTLLQHKMRFEVNHRPEETVNIPSWKTTMESVYFHSFEPQQFT